MKSTVLRFVLSINLMIGVLVTVSNQQIVPKFKCPKIVKPINGTDPDYVDPNKVCVCLNRQSKIVCRLGNYDLSSFDVVKLYFQNLRHVLPYEQRHLNGFSFMFCLNLNYGKHEDIDKEIATIPIGFDTMSGISFDQIMIAYCDQQSMNPVKLKLNPHFLTMQAQSLQRLEIEITEGNNNDTCSLLANLAHAIMRQRKLTQLVIWMGENLRLTIPSRLFAEYSSVNYLVPLEEITFVDDHLQEMDPEADVKDHYQVITIDSFAFAHLHQIRLIRFRDVFIEAIANYAFALSLRNGGHRLTIEFVVNRLHLTKIDINSFSGIDMDTTTSFKYANQVLARRIFVPKNETFGRFLMVNPQNKLRFGYSIDCRLEVIIDKIRWMLEAKHKQWLNADQIELNCSHNNQNIFDYKFEDKSTTTEN